MLDFLTEISKPNFECASYWILHEATSYFFTHAKESKTPISLQSSLYIMVLDVFCVNPKFKIIDVVQILWLILLRHTYPFCWNT